MEPFSRWRGYYQRFGVKQVNMISANVTAKTLVFSQIVDSEPVSYQLKDIISSLSTKELL
jgi:hypothetical protein